MLFRMVPSVLLSMVAQISTFWLVEIPQQPIRIFQFIGFLSYHGEKKERYHVKEHKKLCWKLMSKMSLHFVGGHYSEKQTVGGGLCSTYIGHLPSLPDESLPPIKWHLVFLKLRTPNKVLVSSFPKKFAKLWFLNLYGVCSLFPRKIKKRPRVRKSNKYFVGRLKN